MTKPEVSVVMTVHNSALTLPAAIESILDQQGVAFEFIIIDDGSSDGGTAIVRDYARRDSRIWFERHENRGLTASLIHACSMASADFIARQDADDVSLPGRLKAQLALIRQSSLPVLVGCHARCVSPDRHLLSEVMVIEDPVQCRRHILVDGRSISPHGSIMFRRDAYQKAGGYRPEFYYAQDLDLNIRLAEQGPVAVVPEILYEYQFSPAAISGLRQQEQGAFRELILASRDARGAGRPDDEILEAARALSVRARKDPANPVSLFNAWYFMGSCLIRSNPSRAREHLLAALKIRPWSLKAVIRFLEAVVKSAGSDR